MEVFIILYYIILNGMCLKCSVIFNEVGKFRPIPSWKQKPTISENL